MTNTNSSNPIDRPTDPTCLENVIGHSEDLGVSVHEAALDLGMTESEAARMAWYVSDDGGYDPEGSAETVLNDVWIANNR